QNRLTRFLASVIFTARCLASLHGAFLPLFHGILPLPASDRLLRCLPLFGLPLLAFDKFLQCSSLNVLPLLHDDLPLFHGTLPFMDFDCSLRVFSLFGRLLPRFASDRLRHDSTLGLTPRAPAPPSAMFNSGPVSFFRPMKSISPISQALACF